LKKNEIDNVTTFEVEVSIDNPGQALKANMTARRGLCPDIKAEPAEPLTVRPARPARADALSLRGSSRRFR